jgi:uncharacterized BrkB/YihY/UPF0761 family membrane protein
MFILTIIFILFLISWCSSGYIASKIFFNDYYQVLNSKDKANRLSKKITISIYLVFICLGLLGLYFVFKYILNSNISSLNTKLK